MGTMGDGRKGGKRNGGEQKKHSSIKTIKKRGFYIDDASNFSESFNYWHH